MLTASIFKIFGLSSLLATNGTTLVFTYNSEFILLCLQTIKNGDKFKYKYSCITVECLLIHCQQSRTARELGDWWSLYQKIDRENLTEQYLPFLMIFLSWLQMIWGKFLIFSHGFTPTLIISAAQISIQGVAGIHAPSHRILSPTLFNMANYYNCTRPTNGPLLSNVGPMEGPFVSRLLLFL
jgi:hypothetical protein